MEFTKVEVSILERMEATAAEQSILTLDQMHLAMVGGGCGEVIFG